MSMKKYTSPEKVEVFAGQEAAVVNRHLKRTGKAMSNFTEEELADLQSELESVRGEDSEKTEK